MRNGIYVVFETGETGPGGDRIVRVGTHTGQGRLPSRAAAPREHGHLRDPGREAEVEREVTRRIQETFSFCVVEVPEKEDRLRLERGLASLVAACAECGPSPEWLGRHAPDARIGRCGLWQVQGVGTEPLTGAEVRGLLG